MASPLKTYILLSKTKKTLEISDHVDVKLKFDSLYDLEFTSEIYMHCNFIFWNWKWGNKKISVSEMTVWSKGSYIWRMFIFNECIPANVLKTNYVGPILKRGGVHKMFV